MYKTKSPQIKSAGNPNYKNKTEQHKTDIYLCNIIKRS